MVNDNRGKLIEITLLLLTQAVICFRPQKVEWLRRIPSLRFNYPSIDYPPTQIYLAKNSKTTEEEEYQSPLTGFLSGFMNKEKKTSETEPLYNINFGTTKQKPKLPLSKLASQLDSELYQTEWFVTGKVNPIYFSDDFVFEDPDVKLAGIEAYARGVYKLFDQTCSRAEIISTVVNTTVPNTITCTWRLSGKVKIGPGITIKPYIVYTDFTVDPKSGLIVSQLDRFSIPSWDILLSSLFPFLTGSITAPAAPPIQSRKVGVLEKLKT